MKNNQDDLKKSMDSYDFRINFMKSLSGESHEKFLELLNKWSDFAKSKGIVSYAK